MRGLTPGASPGLRYSIAAWIGRRGSVVVALPRVRAQAEDWGRGAVW